MVVLSIGNRAAARYQQLVDDEYTYRLGASHKKNFEIALFLDGENIATGTGTSKKKAEEAAAKFACESLDL